jgi:hypothetical protein
MKYVESYRVFKNYIFIEFQGKKVNANLFPAWWLHVPACWLHVPACWLCVPAWRLHVPVCACMAVAWDCMCLHGC